MYARDVDVLKDPGQEPIRRLALLNGLDELVGKGREALPDNRWWAECRDALARHRVSVDQEVATRSFVLAAGEAFEASKAISAEDNGCSGCWLTLQTEADKLLMIGHAEKFRDIFPDIGFLVNNLVAHAETFRCETGASVFVTLATKLCGFVPVGQELAAVAVLDAMSLWADLDDASMAFEKLGPTPLERFQADANFVVISRLHQFLMKLQKCTCLTLHGTVGDADHSMCSGGIALAYHDVSVAYSLATTAGLDDLRSKTAQACDDLAKISKGTDDGTSWLTDYEDATEYTIDDLIVHADKTLLAQTWAGGDKLQASLDKYTTLALKTKKAHELVNDSYIEVDADLRLTIAQQAKVTLAECVILWAIKNQKAIGPAKTRRTLKKEHETISSADFTSSSPAMHHLIRSEIDRVAPPPTKHMKVE